MCKYAFMLSSVVAYLVRNCCFRKTDERRMTMTLEGSIFLWRNYKDQYGTGYRAALHYFSLMYQSRLVYITFFLMLVKIIYDFWYFTPAYDGEQKRSTYFIHSYHVYLSACLFISLLVYRSFRVSRLHYTPFLCGSVSLYSTIPRKRIESLLSFIK